MHQHAIFSTWTDKKKRKIRNPPLGSLCITFPATSAPPLASPAPTLFFKFVLLSLFEIIPQELWETNKKSNMAWSQYNALDFHCDHLLLIFQKHPRKTSLGTSSCPFMSKSGLELFESSATSLSADTFLSFPAPSAIRNTPLVRWTVRR